VFVGTGPAAVFKSTDFGENWTFAEQLHTLPETIEWTFPNPPHIAHVKGFGLSREDPSVVFAALEEGWLIRSKDGGETWMTLRNGTVYDSHTVTVMPDNPNVVISASGNGIVRSEDLGDHFVPAMEGLTREYVAQIAFHESAPNVLFTAAAGVPPRDWRRKEGAARDDELAKSSRLVSRGHERRHDLDDRRLRRVLQASRDRLTADLRAIRFLELA
jgi:hypothetical protein